MTYSWTPAILFQAYPTFVPQPALGVDENLGPGHVASTPDLSVLIIESLQDPNWQSGGALTFLIEGQVCVIRIILF